MDLEENTEDTGDRNSPAPALLGYERFYLTDFPGSPACRLAGLGTHNSLTEIWAPGSPRLSSDEPLTAEVQPPLLPTNQRCMARALVNLKCVRCFAQ